MVTESRHPLRRFAHAKSLLTSLIAAIALSCPSPPSGQWRSDLYPGNWSPSTTDGQGRFLHDFSYAGYRQGDALPKDVKGASFNVLDFGANNSGAADATAAIQLAIDAASVAGGVVRFPAGLYRIDGMLRIAASRVVLRGDGPDQSRLYFTKANDMAYKGHITFAGAVQYGVSVPLSTDGQNRAAHVKVLDASAFQPGADISIGWTITDAFVAEHGMTGTWQAFNGQWASFVRRNVVSVDKAATPHRIVLDVPLRYPAKVRDAASVRMETGYIEECGMEDLGIANAVAWDDAWSMAQVRAIEFTGVKDSWIRNVESFASPHPDADGYHLQNCGIRILGSKRVTVADSVLEKAQNRGSGGCGYLFEISQSSEILIRDCAGLDGRHNFIQNWGFGTTGCVFLRCHSAGSRNVVSQDIPIGLPAFSEYHHSLATACLVDSCVLDDGWYGGNRRDESSGAGHSVTQNVYWNTSGGGLIRSFAYGNGYVIGTRGITVQTSLAGSAAQGTAPEDYVEGKGAGSSIEPPSLYEDQRAKRLSR